MRYDAILVSCTKDKAQTTKLYNFTKRLEEFNIDTVKVKFIENNTVGLSENYNKFINDEYAKQYEFAIFVHDDVYIDDFDIIEKLKYAHNNLKYDIIGIAGGINPEIKFPALWHIMTTKQHQRGAVSHPFDNNMQYTTVFGPTPSRVVIADGCFLAVHLQTAVEKQWKFNENYKFHHYDIASCIDANKKKIRVGVYPIHITHESPGLKSFEDVHWKESNERFLKEYNV